MARCAVILPQSALRAASSLERGSLSKKSLRDSSRLRARSRRLIIRYVEDATLYRDRFLHYQLQPLRSASKEEAPDII